MIFEKRWDIDAETVSRALVAGVERMTAWAGLLDRINVFPVADGDTGRNLVMSLGPLRRPPGTFGPVSRKLMFSARGNSGNIAAHFFSGFLDSESNETMVQAADKGRRNAWRAVGDPKPGTMLTVFDALVEILENTPKLDDKSVHDIINRLEKAVLDTPQMLPELKDAGVVDAGALGVFIFFEGFFLNPLKSEVLFRPITDRFKNHLKISPSFKKSNHGGHCVDMVVRSDLDHDMLKKEILSCGDSMVATADENDLKIHLHVRDVETVKAKVRSLGRIVGWSDEKIHEETGRTARQASPAPIHIMTDAAGSLTWEDARRLGVTLLNSYILTPDGAFPETLTAPSDIYPAMRRGEKITTAQASLFERRQHYESLLNSFEQLLYLCVGSVYTGNYDAAAAWKAENDPDGRFTIIDTGAASGRLAVIAMAVAQYAGQTDDPGKIVQFARSSPERAVEYIFLDRLQYLAAGGRISKTGAFFGDMLHVKPIITPEAGGVKKAGIARNENDQIGFALDKLAQEWKEDEARPIMLEYSDNRQWVESIAKQELLNRYPSLDIILQPLSLTSGVHMGPGTWGIAFMTGKK